MYQNTYSIAEFEVKTFLLMTHPSFWAPLAAYIFILSCLFVIKHVKNAFIAPVYGFTDNVDYYRKTSCISFIDSIRVPKLVINSLDDPFFDPSCYPRECNSRPVKLHYTSYGGHLGFMLHQETSCEDKATATTSSWMPSELARFFKHVRDSIHD